MIGKPWSLVIDHAAYAQASYLSRCMSLCCLVQLSLRPRSLGPDCSHFGSHCGLSPGVGWKEESDLMLQLLLDFMIFVRKQVKAPRVENAS